MQRNLETIHSCGRSAGFHHVTGNCPRNAVGTLKQIYISKWVWESGFKRGKEIKQAFLQRMDSTMVGDYWNASNTEVGI
jgi:hypothetical protein